MRPETDCLSRTMRRAGHSLDWSCGLCAFECTYAAPCGCGGTTCVDVVLGNPRAGVAAAA